MHFAPKSVLDCFFHCMGEDFLLHIAYTNGQAFIDAFNAASPQQLRVVVVHHPAAVIHAEDRADVLLGHQAALQCWSAAGLDLILGGHIHLPYILELQGLARPAWVVQAGTAVSSRTRLGAPNSVNILRWGHAHTTCGGRGHPGYDAENDCVIERWDFAPEAHTFVCKEVTWVRPERT